MKSINYFFCRLHCKNIEEVVIKLLAIDEQNLDNQLFAINALESIDSKLNEQVLSHSVIWDQLIRCYGGNNTFKPFLLDLKKETSQKKNHSGASIFFDNLRFDLENHHLRIQRDNITLKNEQLLQKQLLLQQQEIILLLDKLYCGLTENLMTKRLKNKVESNFLKKRFLYGLKIKREELTLQSTITKQGIESLSIIQNNNHILLSNMSNVLPNVL